MLIPARLETSPWPSPSPQSSNQPTTPPPESIPYPSLKGLLDAQSEHDDAVDLAFGRAITVVKAIMTISHFGPEWKKSCLALIKAYIKSNPDDEGTIVANLGSVCDAGCGCVHHLTPTAGDEDDLLPTGFVDCRCGFIPPPTKRV